MQDSKSLRTLLSDIREIFEGEHKVSEENLDLFAQNCKEVLRKSVEEAGIDQEATVRMSSIGTPDRKLWYSLKNPLKSSRSLTADNFINFCYGHILEEFLLFLVRESGHKVTHEQEEVEIDGVKGHMDCCIDGVPVDIKSASQFGFTKFKEGSLLHGDDPFGYIDQLSGYANALGKDEAAFLAINKNKGELALLPVGDIFITDTKERIQHINEILEEESPPDRCYDDKPFGESGNRELSMPCVFCPFKFKCWDNLRVFQYSGGPKYLTETVREPKVPDITGAYKDITKKDRDNGKSAA